MNIYLAFVVILVTVGAAFTLGWTLNRGNAELDRIRLLAELDEATANVQLPRAGRFPDTGPLLILSETAAAGDALEREIRLRCAEAESKIPPRWR